MDKHAQHGGKQLRGLQTSSNKSSVEQWTADDNFECDGGRDYRWFYGDEVGVLPQDNGVPA